MGGQNFCEANQLNGLADFRRELFSIEEADVTRCMSSTEGKDGEEEERQPGQPLILTPLIQSGNYTEAARLAEVKGVLEDVVSYRSLAKRFRRPQL